jgi:predicted AAA+ superfamily ATPase
MEIINNDSQTITVNTQPINSSIGRSHMAPSKYKYFVKLSADSTFMNDLKYENHSAIGNVSSPDGTPYLLNGYNKINDTSIYVVNQEKQGYYYLWFYSFDDAKTLFDEVNENNISRNKTKKNSIYKFTKNGWQQLNTYDSRDLIDLIGYDHYIDTISKDINNYKLYISFLKSIGEGSRTLNYLLYGPPGTGKTTLIKTLATKFDLPIYIVNASLMDNVNASTVLNPKSNANKQKIILFEDFDRYLKEGKFNMADILNELDGIESTDNCIRFFTCNDIDEIYKHDALINRINSKFLFNYPIKEQFEQKLNRLLTFLPAIGITIDETKKSLFINKFMKLNDTKNEKTTLRPFTTYVIRHLFDENCLDKLLENINELVN